MGPQIIQVNLTSEQPHALAAGEALQFTYSIKWTPTSTPFSRRFERYLDYNFFEHQVLRPSCSTPSSADVMTLRASSRDIDAALPAQLWKQVHVLCATLSYEIQEADTSQSASLLQMARPL